jgi:hypothetical protein
MWEAAQATEEAKRSFKNELRVSAALAERRNFVGLTRLWGTRFGWVWNFQYSAGRLRLKPGREWGGIVIGHGFLRPVS